jgi:hypothetical protein
MKLGSVSCNRFEKQLTEKFANYERRSIISWRHGNR